MKENQVLLDYYITDDLMVIFQASNNSLEHNVINLPSDFESVLNRGLRNVKSGKSGKRINTNKLNKYLIDTWIDKCNESSELIVCYDQYLWKYPIELLKLDKGEFLIEKMPVSYIYSPELYSSIREFEYENDILLMAPGFLDNTGDYYKNLRMVDDIDSNRVWKTGNQLIPLPYSISEVSSIENLGLEKGLRVAKYTKNMATKRTFFNYYRDTKIIHIATHGFASKTDTYKTGIFFAGQGGQSNFLSMNELYTEESHANLVVLSACQTGYGEIIKGEGVMALPRGFLLSGVPNVVCSLWKIHDVKTRDLMMEFYKALLDGQSYSKSLQLARKKLIEEGELPMDWGVMIHIGSN
jgi:CHAT domain-containing protein